MDLLVFTIATAIPLQNFVDATAAAFGMLWDRLTGQGGAPGIAASHLERALAPLYGATWDMIVLTSNAVVGTARINHIWCILRNPPLRR